LRKSRPILPEKLSDRQQDIAEPLLAIADEAGGDWPEKARQGLVHLCEGAEESESAGVKLLRAILSVFTEDEIFTSDLLSRLPEAEQGEIPLWWVKEMDNKRTGGPEKSLATMLGKYGIKSTRLRIDDVQRRGYRKADFMTTWKKYLPDLFAQNPSQASQASQKGHSVTDVTDVTRS
jgi:hypothetical protein